jgi:hypothetical protein
MIHLHEKLWVVINKNRKCDDSEYCLAYMTHAEYNKDGTEKDNFIKRKNTGTGWATIRDSSSEDFYFDNSPVKGFTVAGSVSRWSTDNKVVRIEDPRKFVVEIPVSALTTLLKYTTLVNGIVQEECLWGKEGNNHILIPVNSEVYQKAKAQTEQNSSKVKINTLKEGDVVKFSVDGETYCYVGKYRIMWEVSTKLAQKTSSWSGVPVSASTDPTVRTQIINEDGYSYLFKYLGENSWKRGESKKSGSCIVVGNMEVPEVKMEDYSIYRTNGIFPETKLNYKEYYTSQVKEIIKK